MNPFQGMSLAVFGPGLLGGSLLLDARARGVRELRVWGRREESLRQVRERGLADLASTDAQVPTGRISSSFVCLWVA